jgi:transcription initiation factor TFIIIB Brf1 subunit/transcription initiation factor TFIIB
VFIDVQRICKELVGKPATPLRYFHIISRELGLKATIPTVENYVVKFVNDLGGDKELEMEALRICRLYNGSNVNAKCVAAAAMYMACTNLGIPKTQKAIKDITTVSEVTIRTWIAMLKKIPGAEKKREPLESDRFDNVQDEE